MIAKKSTPKKSAPKKSAPKKSAPKKSAPKKSAPKKSTPKKSTPKKSAPKKSTPKKSAPKKSTPKKSAPKKSTPKKSAPKKSTKINKNHGICVYYLGHRGIGKSSIKTTNMEETKKKLMSDSDVGAISCHMDSKKANKLYIQNYNKMKQKTKKN